MGSRVGKQQKCKGPSGIEYKMVKAMKDRGAAAKSSIKSFNSIIMKFSKIDATFEKVRFTFKRFGNVPSSSLFADGYLSWCMIFFVAKL